MARFSLIVATIGRTEEFGFLLQSLAEQTFRDFELIVVDQNSDDRLIPFLEHWNGTVAGLANTPGSLSAIIHLRCAPGVSRARNLGLQYCTGEILAFPDD